MGVVVSVVKLKIYLTWTSSCFKVTHSLTLSQKLERMKLTVTLNKITNSLGLNIVGFVSVLTYCMFNRERQVKNVIQEEFVIEGSLQ